MPKIVVALIFFDILIIPQIFKVIKQ